MKQKQAKSQKVDVANFDTELLTAAVPQSCTIPYGKPVEEGDAAALQSKSMSAFEIMMQQIELDDDEILDELSSSDDDNHNSKVNDDNNDCNFEALKAKLRAQIEGEEEDDDEIYDELSETDSDIEKTENRDQTTVQQVAKLSITALQ